MSKAITSTKQFVGLRNNTGLVVTMRRGILKRYLCVENNKHEIIRYLAKNNPEKCGEQLEELGFDIDGFPFDLIGFIKETIQKAELNDQESLLHIKYSSNGEVELGISAYKTIGTYYFKKTWNYDSLDEAKNEFNHKMSLYNIQMPQLIEALKSLDWI